MRAAEEDRDWWTTQRERRQSLRPISGQGFAEGDGEISLARAAIDPGMQYDTTINRWHTCKTTDRIYASNPCSDYMLVDDTACNLASLNLLKFLGSNGQFDTEGFRPRWT